MFYSTQYMSPVGPLLLVSNEKSIIGVWMEGQKYYAATLQETAAQREDLPVLRQTVRWLDRYFAGGKPAVSEVPLAPVGSDFRKAVWSVLCDIPYGEVMTYGDIAKVMARHMGREQMSAQAIGGAVGHNPVSIIIPCHRVVGAGGSLTGYAGGVHTKRRLLELEGVDVSRFSVPTKGTAL